MSKSITLVKRVTESTTYTGNVLLVIEATTADSTSKEVFVNQRVKKTDGTFEDAFVSVASPVQLVDLSVNTPDETTSYFRTAKIELVCFSAEFAQKVWDDVQLEVATLIKDLNTMDILSEATTVVIT